MSRPIKVEGIEEGDTRPGDEFRFTSSPTAWASSTFTAIVPDGAIVTRRFSHLQGLPPETPVVAHWHGEWRTDDLHQCSRQSRSADLSQRGAGGELAVALDHSFDADERRHIRGVGGVE